MLIGIPQESKAGETLVAGTAKTVGQLQQLGYEVVVESGCGTRAEMPDEKFTEAGARVGSADEVWAADVVVKVNAPTDDEVARMRRGAVLISMVAPARNPELLEKLQNAGITALAMDAVPRISRAQSMDVLSSMANVAGYRAVVEAAHEFGRMFTGQDVHGPGHGGRQDPAGPRLRRGRRRGGPRCDRCGIGDGRGRPRLRRAPRGRRTG